MGRRAANVIEYRSYDLPPHFPIRLIAGDDWHISDVPSGVLHFHNCLEIGLCESDSGKMDFAGTVLPFKSGDVTVVAGDVLHTTWSDPGCSSKWRYLFTDAEELLRPFFAIDKLPNTRLLSGLLNGWYGIFPAADNPNLAYCVRQMMQEMADRKLNYEISVRGLFVSFITELMRQPAQGSTGTPMGSMVIAPALTYINNHYMDNFTICDLADVCNMSQSHFRRVFHELMGIGPLEHLNRTRITKACSLLRMTDESILTIGEQVGFRSMSSFNRHFAEAMGCSPSEWRRSVGTGRSTSILKYNGWLTPPRDK